MSTGSKTWSITEDTSFLAWFTVPTCIFIEAIKAVGNARVGGVVEVKSTGTAISDVAGCSSAKACDTLAGADLTLKGEGTGDKLTVGTGCGTFSGSNYFVVVCS